ncbi:MAG: prepilin-type N-terminal cleavage/methylation domain-containing protein [Burkholderiales bacterium]|nr:prepilin-type N-terminal cleavage/methylation domain-containing protein [Burkholderiales bacterium]
MRKQNGFTLIEIAIVLVIVGLLLGGVLKGQELITAARVRNIATTLDGVKIAYLGFQDRFRVLPGDYENALAIANIPGATAGCTLAGGSCQNGRIDNTIDSESILVWHHLSKSGFITGSYDGAGAAGAPAAASTPGNNATNPFAGYLRLMHSVDYTGNGGITALLTQTGTNIPASILGELDRKVDDGNPGTGSFRNAPAWGAPDAACLAGVAPNQTYNAAADIKNCGGASIN